MCKKINVNALCAAQCIAVVSAGATFHATYHTVSQGQASRQFHRDKPVGSFTGTSQLAVQTAPCHDTA